MRRSNPRSPGRFSVVHAGEEVCAKRTRGVRPPLTRLSATPALLTCLSATPARAKAHASLTAARWSIHGGLSAAAAATSDAAGCTCANTGRQQHGCSTSKRGSTTAVPGPAGAEWRQTLRSRSQQSASLPKGRPRSCCVLLTGYTQRRMHRMLSSSATGQPATLQSRLQHLAHQRMPLSPAVHRNIPCLQAARQGNPQLQPVTQRARCMTAAADRTCMRAPGLRPLWAPEEDADAGSCWWVCVRLDGRVATR